MLLMAEFHEIFSELRKDRHLTQKTLAEKMNVTGGTVSNYETGRHQPDPAALKWFADFFGVTVDYLLGRTEYMTSIEVFDETVSGQHTVGSLVERITSMSEKNKELACEMIDAIYISDIVKNHDVQSEQEK